MGDWEELHSGELYFPGKEEILREQAACLEKLYAFNATRPCESEQRERLLSDMFAQIGEGCYIEPPLRANFGGKHVHFGHHVYANFNLTLVDDTHIYVGDYTMIGPNVTIRTCVNRAFNTTGPCSSGATAGSARAPSSCRACISGRTPWWAQEALSQRICLPTSWRWANPAACCAPWEKGRRRRPAGSRKAETEGPKGRSFYHGFAKALKYSSSPARGRLFAPGGYQKIRSRSRRDSKIQKPAGNSIPFRKTGRTGRKDHASSDCGG